LGLDATDDINNFVAGFGDAGTFGLSRYLRERAGCNATTFFGRSVNSGSGFYTGGEATLTTASLVTGGAGLVKSGFKFGAKQLAKNSLVNSKFAPRVLVKIAKDPKDLFHNFPNTIDNFAANYGVVKTFHGGDGLSRIRVTLQGNVNGQKGFFEWIIEPNGIIKHRFFKPLGEQ
jgi:hypothetical protein